MQALVEASIFRKIKIIHALAMDYESLSDHDIARLNDCSFSTVKNDLAEIQKEYSHVFAMEAEHGRIRFGKKNSAESNKIIEALFSESLNLQLILEIFDNPFQSRHVYCRATRISEASFYRSLKHINKVFRPYGFLIQFYQGGYFLRGKNEEEVRKFIVSLYLETKTQEQCFVRIPFKLLKELVADNVLKTLPLELDLYTSYYTYYVYVSLIRESQNFNLHKSKEKHTYEEYQVLSEYFPKLRQEALYSIHQNFLSQREPWGNSEEKNQTLKILQEFMAEFTSFNKKHYDEALVDKLLWMSVLSYGGFELFPAKYKMIFNRIDVFIDAFKTNKPTMYDYFQDLFLSANSKLQRPFLDQGNQLLFLIEILWPDFFIKSKKIKVQIISDLGLEHENFYKKMFYNLFYDLEILDKPSQDKADFIIANHVVEAKTQPIVFIADYPSLGDLSKIYETILRFLEK